MIGRRLALAALLAAAPAAQAAVRPGPPLLYAKAHTSPVLAPAHGFRAQPLLVSGTDAYRRGEYLYQDYLFDDHGADTTPGLGASANWASQPLFCPAAGDAEYPPGDRYRNNAADLAEFRVRATRTSVIYRVALTTATAADAAVVGIGIDTDRSGGPPVAWPYGAGVSSPGIDAFVTAWGTGGAVTRGGANTPLPAGAVTMDLARNQMTIRVPRSLLDPGTRTWRYVAATGLWDPRARTWMAPGVFNVAFRFHEPVAGEVNTETTTAPGAGSWFEDGQAKELAAGTTGDDHADVDFAALAARRSRGLHRPGRVQVRVLSSALPIPEGVDHAKFPEFGGSLQPYIVTLPAGYRRGTPTPVIFTLHPSNANYTTFNTFMPNWAKQVGAKRIVVTLLDRGLDGPDGVTGQYTGAAEAGFFEAWADLARHYTLDPARITLGGYSLGSYADFHLAELWPDLFAGMFAVVGTAPTNGRDTEILGNLRWVPVLQWNQADDALVPYSDVHAAAQTMDDLGLRHELWTFAAGNHLAPALRDDWQAGADRLGDPVVQRAPWRVDYGYYPSLDDRRDGIVHDHVYWISGLRLANARTPSAELARADVSARSLAFGLGDAPAATYTSAGASGGTPATITGTRWGAAPHTPAKNELDLTLKNVARLVVDGRAARLRPAGLIVHATTDTATRLVVRFGRRVRVFNLS